MKYIKLNEALCRRVDLKNYDRIGYMNTVNSAILSGILLGVMLMRIVDIWIGFFIN